MLQRKSTTVVTILLIASILFTSCAPVAAPAANTTQGQASAGEKVTLVMWHNHPEWKSRVQAILDVFEKENPTIHIDLQEIPGPDYTVKRNTAMTAGEGPDLIAFSPGSELRAARDAGYIYDLTDLIKIDALNPSAKDAAQVDGKVYALPILGLYTVALYYHKDIFEKYQLTPPTNWDELKAVSEKLKAQGIAPMMAPAQDGVIPFFLYMLVASSILKADGFEKVRQGKIKLTDPELLPAAQFLHDLYPYFQEGALGTPYVEGKALFAHGRAAMMEGGSADFAGFTEVNPDVKLGVVPFPSPAGVGAPSTVTGMESPFAINKQTKHVDQAVTFLKWMLTKTPGQMVADNITLPTIEGVTPSNNPAMQEMIKASKSNDVRVWYEFPETGKIGDVVRDHVQELFTDAITPEQFAKLLQDSITPSTK